MNIRAARSLTEIEFGLQRNQEALRKALSDGDAELADALNECIANQQASLARLRRLRRHLVCEHCGNSYNGDACPCTILGYGVSFVDAESDTRAE